LKEINQREKAMGLVVSAQVIRELIAEGEYLIECIEQRERGKVAVALELRSRVQPYSIQIETTDNKLAGLFRALLNEKPSTAEKPALVKLGSQLVPVVEIESVPADAPKARRRRKQGVNGATGPQSSEPTKRSVRGRTAARQLALVEPEVSHHAAATSRPSKHRRAARANDRDDSR
jgi:hypothetical protein